MIGRINKNKRLIPDYSRLINSHRDINILLTDNEVDKRLRWNISKYKKEIYKLGVRINDIIWFIINTFIESPFTRDSGYNLNVMNRTNGPLYYAKYNELVTFKINTFSRIKFKDTSKYPEINNLEREFIVYKQIYYDSSDYLLSLFK